MSRRHDLSLSSLRKAIAAVIVPSSGIGGSVAGIISVKPSIGCICSIARSRWMAGRSYLLLLLLLLDMAAAAVIATGRGR